MTMTGHVQCHRRMGPDQETGAKRVALRARSAGASFSARRASRRQLLGRR